MSEVTFIPPHSCIPGAVHLLTQHSGLFLIFHPLPLVTGWIHQPASHSFKEVLRIVLYILAIRFLVVFRVWCCDGFESNYIECFCWHIVCVLWLIICVSFILVFIVFKCWTGSLDSHIDFNLWAGWSSGWLLAGAEISLQNVEIGSGAHSAAYLVGTGVFCSVSSGWATGGKGVWVWDFLFQCISKDS